MADISQLSDGTTTWDIKDATARTAIAGKQDKLTAGANITISGTTISAVDTTYSNATQSDAGLMSAADKTKLDGIADNANDYVHPTYTARTGKPTANQTPAFGGTATVSQITSDGTGHVTAATDRTIKIPDTEATTSLHGLMSAADKAKLDGIEAGATAVTVDSSLNSTSTNPVENKAIVTALAAKQDNITAGTGLAFSGTTLNHSNAVTAGTIGTSSATSGATIAVPYATYDAQGHIKTKGTHTHTVSGFLEKVNYQTGVSNNAEIRPIVTKNRPNRLFGLPADQIIIEQTVDGGTTWTDAGVSDSTKIALFTIGSGAAVYLPLLNGARSTLCGLRITITGMKYDVPSGTAETGKYAYWNSNHVLSNERYCSIDLM